MDFLDKLEQLLISSQNVVCRVIKYDFEDNLIEQPIVCIEQKNDFFSEKIPEYIQEYIQSIKKGKEFSKYRFIINIFEKNDNNVSIFDEILQLKPTDDNLLSLYRYIHVEKEDFFIFLKTLQDKSSCIKILSNRNSCIFVDSHKNFLNNCFNLINYFVFSEEEYYTIFHGYINNTFSIQDKDELMSLCLEYITKEEYLQSLIEMIYDEKITFNPFSNKKTFEKIQINRLHLINDYGIISAIVLDHLLNTFINQIRENFSILNHTTSIEYYKSPNHHNHCKNNNCIFNLLIETNDIEEILSLLDIYLKYFVTHYKNINNYNIEKFIQEFKNQPQIFKNFIMYKKINKKLDIKKFKHDINKI